MSSKFWAVHVSVCAFSTPGGKGSGGLTAVWKASPDLAFTSSVSSLAGTCCKQQPKKNKKSQDDLGALLFFCEAPLKREEDRTHSARGL